MPALILFANGERKEHPPKNGKYYKAVELQLAFGLGRMGVINLYGFLFLYNREAEDLFAASGETATVYAYNPHASAILTTHLKDVPAIFGPVILVPREETEFGKVAK